MIWQSNRLAQLSPAYFGMVMATGIKGFTIFYWATGTWWIPMLLLLGVWRYLYKRFPLHYDPLYWGVTPCRPQSKQFALGLIFHSRKLAVKAS